MSADQPKVHLDRDGRARCGHQGTCLLGSEQEVTCRRCAGIMNGTYGIGYRKPTEPCGTAAAVRRHRRHHDPLDDACRDYERRRNNVYRDANRDAINARKRARKAELRKLKEVPVLISPADAEVCERLIARYAPDAAGLLADMLGLAA